MKSEQSNKKKKRSATRYWIEINGNLYARFQYKTEAGVYKVKYRPLTDKRTARTVVEKMRRELEIHGQEIFQSEKMTFDQLVDRYSETELVEATFQDGIKVKGRRSVGPVKSNLKPLQDYFGKKTVRSIKPADLKSYKNLRLATPVEIKVNETQKVFDETTGKETIVIQKIIRSRQRKVATVNRELTTLRTMLNFAVANEWLITNPFAKSKGLISAAAEAKRDRVLSFDEEQRLLDACVGQRAHIRPVIICALDTAMRRGEIFKMRWRDVDFIKNQITIPQTNTKTEETRIVGMTSRLRTELEILWGRSPRKRDFLVFGVTSTIKTAFRSACNDANIQGFRFHDCRHTATTRMVSSGSPHTEVMKITGHSQMTTFLRYLNITQETANEVAERLRCYMEQQSNNADTTSDSVN